MTTPTNDRDDLYKRAMKAHTSRHDWVDGIRAVVDLVLDARPAERQPWEVLREAAQIYERRWPARTTGGDLRIEADRIEAEHHAAQEKAAAEAERKKLIEQAARSIFDHTVGEEWHLISEAHREHYRAAARKVRDMLDAPTTDGGAA